MYPHPGEHPTCRQDASKNSVRSNTQETCAVSFLFSTSPVAEMRPCPEGSGEDASSCRTVPGGCPSAGHRVVPPTSHWLWAPLSLAGGDVWQPASLIQVCRERRTGMRLWGRTSPSSGRCQLAPRSPVPLLRSPGSSANLCLSHSASSLLLPLHLPLLSGAPSPGMTWCW